MVEFIGLRKGPQIVAYGPDDLAQLERLRPGRQLRVAITYDRSSKHNRWFHKLIGVVADGLGMDPAVLKIELKHKAGLFDQITVSRVFGVHVDYRSTAFKEMDEPDFTAFRREAVDILFTDYLPGVKRKDVYAQVEDLTGERCPW
jgi:hypothetical protein